MLAFKPPDMEGKDTFQSLSMYPDPDQTLPLFEDKISSDLCENILQNISNILNQFRDIGILDFQTDTISGSNKTSFDTNVPSTEINFSSV